MTDRTIRFLSTILAVILLSRTMAMAQAKPIPAGPIYSWTNTSLRTQSDKKLVVITIAEPTHRFACRVLSSTDEQLECQGSRGKTRIYRPQQIAALILPGQGRLREWLWIGFNTPGILIGWATLRLGDTCKPCAVPTGVAFALFGVAHSVHLEEYDPDHLIYLAPPEQLHDAKGRTIRLKHLPAR